MRIVARPEAAAAPLPRVVGLHDARGVVPQRRLELLPDVGDVVPQAIQGPGLGPRGDALALRRSLVAII